MKRVLNNQKNDWFSLCCFGFWFFCQKKKSILVWCYDMDKWGRRIKFAFFFWCTRVKALRYFSIIFFFKCSDKTKNIEDRFVR